MLVADIATHKTAIYIAPVNSRGSVIMSYMLLTHTTPVRFDSQATCRPEGLPKALCKCKFIRCLKGKQSLGAVTNRFVMAEQHIGSGDEWG